MRPQFIALVLGFQILALSAFAEEPTIRAIQASSISLNLNGERPSCEKLAWRLVTALSRLSEVGALRDKLLVGKSGYGSLAVVAGRVANDVAEGTERWIEQTLEFPIANVTPENFQLREISTPSMKWINVTPNVSDLIGIEVLPGVVRVKISMSYPDYCFYRESSFVKIAVNGEEVILNWSTPKRDLDRYLKLIE